MSRLGMTRPLHTGSSWRLGVVAAAVTIIAASIAQAQTPMVPSTKTFVADAGNSDQFEIVEGQTAMAQSQDKRVQAFARDMIQDHMQTRQTMQSAAMKAGLKVSPPSLGGDQAKLLGALQSQRGADFDRTYLKQQVLAHQVALIEEQAYASNGADPSVRQAARSAIPIIQHHLSMAKQLRDDLGAQ